MARRSSARLANRSTSTPKRVSLSHDAPTRTPRTAPVKLSALHESDEMPGAFPQSASPAPRFAPATEYQRTTMIPLKFDNTTPKKTTPVKPATEEMHPDQHHQSTVKASEEARWLGFTNMAPHTEPPKQTSRLATLQATPTRVTNISTDIKSPKYQFSFYREQSLELSPEAKKLMSEKREEAARIREQMIASGEGVQQVGADLGRRIATPRSKKGRFSDMHTEEFNKMDSIANHPSARRAAAAKETPPATPIRVQTIGQKVVQTAQSPTKSLKRSPSKAELDEPHSQPHSSLSRASSKMNLGQHLAASQLSRPTSTKSLSSDVDALTSSPAKRQKRSAAQDVSIAKPSSSGSDRAHPTTPMKRMVEHADPSNIASPTLASLARAASVKAGKTTGIPLPTLAHSPSKPTLHVASPHANKSSTPLLARSPSKATLFSRPDQTQGTEETRSTTSPLLLRSPLKGSVLKKPDDAGEKDMSRSIHRSLLSRSPLKASFAKSSEPVAKSDTAAPSTPLLARSPAKIAMPVEQAEEVSTTIPNKSSSTSLLGRFNLLRASPMKSILRSPQRLYSDDPAQVAAGTHLATPPKLLMAKNKSSTPAVAATAPVQKRVDFTSSTKDRYERAQSELSSTPSKGPTPPPQSDAEIGSSSKPSASLYPSLPLADETPTVTPQIRRQTATPADFTFRAGEHTIMFSQSPSAPLSAASNKRPSTIRHVSAEPQFSEYPLLAPPTTKKRKFDFENEKAVDTEMTDEASDKENAGEEGTERPAKRVKQSDHSPSPPKPAPRRTTLGVKPKKGERDGRDKKPSTISRARLNALSQPKRRA